MPKAKSILFLFALLTSIIATAQEDKVKLIKEGVRFRVNINNPKIDIPGLDTCNSLGSLIHYAKQTRITGLGDLTNSWGKGKAFVTNDLDSLSRIIKESLTGGSKSSRKTQFKADYDALVSNMQAISKPKDIAAQTNPAPVKPIVVTPGKTDSSATNHSLNSSGTTEKGGNALLYSGFAIAVLSLGFCIWLFKKQAGLTNHLKKLAGNGTPNKGDESILQGEEINKLRNDIEEIQVTLKTLQRGQQTTNPGPFMAVEKQKTETEFSKSNGESEIKYAKSSINGVFSSSDLKNRQNGECVFELHITGNTASLKLSSDSKVHQYALSMNPDYYFKNDICDIQGLPSTNKTIKVNNDGSLKLSADGNNWLVNKKISLSFT